MSFSLLPYLVALLFSVTLLFSVKGGEVGTQALQERSIWEVEVKPDPEVPGKWKLEGSVFAIGDPVHETLTLQALIDGGVVRQGTGRKDDSVAQYIRGVFWNDDPCALLFTEDHFRPLEPSLGWVWWVEFRQAATAESQRVGFSNLKTCPLLGRSHFGDLQFLHGMAERNGVKAAETFQRMLAWTSVSYRIAIGDLGADIPLEADPTAKALGLVIGNWSAMRLFRASTEGATRARALGSLLHMIQDSYARGHVSRVASGNDAGAINQFLSYVDQDEKKHAHDDSWSAKGPDDLARTLAIPEASDALIASTEIVRLYKAGTKWSLVEQYLRNSALRVLRDARDSGPGDYK